MSDQTSIFGNNPEATPQQQQTQSSTPASTTPVVDDRLANLLADIKNERGEPKYKDPLEALNGLKHAQEYIPQLKSQLTDREALIQQQAAEIERLRQVELSVQQLTQVKEPTQTQQTTPTAGMTPEQIAELVQQQLTQREQQATQAQNLSTVVSTLQQTLGADAEKVFYSKAAELGMTQEEINRLAATKPKAVLTMFGITDTVKKTSTPSPTSSTVNTSAFQPTQESYIGRNPKTVLIGATTDDLRMSTDRAKKMVEELSQHGLSIADLTNPKIYNKYFK